MVVLLLAGCNDPIATEKTALDTLNAQRREIAAQAFERRAKEVASTIRTGIPLPPEVDVVTRQMDAADVEQMKFIDGQIDERRHRLAELEAGHPR